MHNVLLQADSHGQKLAASGPAARGRVVLAASPEGLAKISLAFLCRKDPQAILLYTLKKSKKKCWSNNLSMSCNMPKIAECSCLITC